ncbi:MAG: hypothetical protein JST26_01715 [Bacteroidetes bacterium]|nr:hypothetical protein [Bacteroidota bacterium]
MRFLYPIIFIFILGTLQAQEEQKILPRFSIRAHIGIPKVTSSRAFRTSFLGLYDCNASVNVRLFSNFHIGVGYKNALMKAQDYFKQKNIYTKMQVHNGFLNIGYDRFYAENSYATFSINAGYSFNKYTNVVPKSDTLIRSTPPQFTTSFLEPTIGFYYLVEDNFAIGAHISYTYSMARFDPSIPYMDKWLGYQSYSNNWNMSWLSFGFGFYYGLVRKK